MYVARATTCRAPSRGMGATQSASMKPRAPSDEGQREATSRHAEVFRRLYDELSCPDDAGKPATEDVFKVTS